MPAAVGDSNSVSLMGLGGRRVGSPRRRMADLLFECVLGETSGVLSSPRFESGKWPYVGVGRRWPLTGFGGGWNANREGRGGGGVMRYVRDDFGDVGVEVICLKKLFLFFVWGASQSSGDVAGELHSVVEADTVIGEDIGESAISVSLSTGSLNVEKASLKPGLLGDLERGGVWNG